MDSSSKISLSVDNDLWKSIEHSMNYYYRWRESKGLQKFNMVVDSADFWKLPRLAWSFDQVCQLLQLFAVYDTLKDKIKQFLFIGKFSGKKFDVEKIKTGRSLDFEFFLLERNVLDMVLESALKLDEYILLINSFQQKYGPEAEERGGEVIIGGESLIRWILLLSNQWWFQIERGKTQLGMATCSILWYDKNLPSHEKADEWAEMFGDTFSRFEAYYETHHGWDELILSVLQCNPRTRICCSSASLVYYFACERISITNEERRLLDILRHSHYDGKVDETLEPAKFK